jgi:hypothetical protein
MSELQEHKLPRTGDAPVRFRGAVLADVSGRWYAGRDQSRWHAVKVFRTAAGRHVVSIVYHTQWQGETNTHQVEIVDALHDAVARLRAFNPVADVIGYPPTEAYSDRQSRLIEDITRRWRDLLTEVLTELNIEDTVE